MMRGRSLFLSRLPVAPGPAPAALRLCLRQLLCDRASATPLRPGLPPLLAVGGQGAWATRSKASLLLALVIKRTGAELWEAALPQLVAAAGEGPALQVGGAGGPSMFFI